jgi:putative membrane protein
MMGGVAHEMSMAGERTYLAQLRTGLGLVAAGVALAGALPDAAAEGLRRGLGLGIVLLGAAVLGSARSRWKKIDRAMRRGEPFPSSYITNWLGWLLAAVAVVAAAIVLVL